MGVGEQEFPVRSLVPYCVRTSGRVRCASLPSTDPRTSYCVHPSLAVSDTAGHALPAHTEQGRASHVRFRVWQPQRSSVAPRQPHTRCERVVLPGTAPPRFLRARDLGVALVHGASVAQGVSRGKVSGVDSRHGGRQWTQEA